MVSLRSQSHAYRRGRAAPSGGGQDVLRVGGCRPEGALLIIRLPPLHMRQLLHASRAMSRKQRTDARHDVSPSACKRLK